MDLHDQLRRRHDDLKRIYDENLALVTENARLQEALSSAQSALVQNERDHNELLHFRQQWSSLKSQATLDTITISNLTRRVEELEDELREERQKLLALRRISGHDSGPSHPSSCPTVQPAPQQQQQRPSFSIVPFKRKAELPPAFLHMKQLLGDEGTEEDLGPPPPLHIRPHGQDTAVLVVPLPRHIILPLRCNRGPAYLILAQGTQRLLQADTVVFEGKNLSPIEFLKETDMYRASGTWGSHLRITMEGGEDLTFSQWEELKNCGLVQGNRRLQEAERTRRRGSPMRPRAREGEDGGPPPGTASPGAVRSSPRLNRTAHNAPGSGMASTSGQGKAARSLQLAPKRRKREEVEGAGAAAEEQAAAAAGEEGPPMPKDPCAICWNELPHNCKSHTKSGRRRQKALAEAAGAAGAFDRSVSRLGCSHRFHRSCIQQWITRCNTCPTCRTEVGEFEGRKLQSRNALKDEIVRESQEFEEIVCGVCGSGEDEDLLLLCDGCNSGIHIFCLDPPLAEVPLEEWFCAHCSETRPAPAVTQQAAGRAEDAEAKREGRAQQQPTPGAASPTSSDSIKRSSSGSDASDADSD